MKGLQILNIRALSRTLIAGLLCLTMIMLPFGATLANGYEVISNESLVQTDLPESDDIRDENDDNEPFDEEHIYDLVPEPDPGDDEDVVVEEPADEEGTITLPNLPVDEIADDDEIQPAAEDDLIDVPDELMDILFMPLSSSGANIDMSDSYPPSSGIGWTYSGGVYTILNGANVLIEGDNQSSGSSQRRLVVSANANVTITLDTCP